MISSVMMFAVKVLMRPNECLYLVPSHDRHDSEQLVKRVVSLILVHLRRTVSCHRRSAAAGVLLMCDG